MASQGAHIDRRQALECMAWAGTGALWTVSGGTPHALGLLGEARAATAAPFTFLQISDSHVGFDKAANPDALATLRETIGQVRALPVRPAFMIHTGDITHLSRASEFDAADEAIRASGVETFYVPGEHDVIDEGRGRSYLERYGRKAKGSGWFSFDAGGAHFIGLVNVVDLEAGGLGKLGPAQLAWLEDDLRGRSASEPIVVFAHIPLWSIYEPWGWGTDDGLRAMSLLNRFGSVTVLNGHIHQIVQKTEGHMTFHTARSTAFPQPAPGAAPAPGPMVVASEQLRNYLGLTRVDMARVDAPVAIIDLTLAGKA